ncbi:MAG: hypothetical protein RLZZ342_707, partial [Candidatus Parcubacteria bacterium]
MDTTLKDEIGKKIIRELGLEGVSQEIQQATLAGIGENIFARMLFEIF